MAVLCPPKAGTFHSSRGLPRASFKYDEEENIMGREILLWLLGVPIPIIILLAIFWH